MKTVKASELIELGVLKAQVITDSSCDCVPSFDPRFGITWDGNECWNAKRIELDGWWIEYVQFDGLSIRKNCEGYDIEDDCESDLEARLVELLDIDDSEEHPSHSDDERAERIKDSLESEGYHAFYDAERGFANEYRVLITHNADFDGSDFEDGGEWEKIDLERAGREIAYSGDAATEAFNSLIVLD